MSARLIGLAICCILFLFACRPDPPLPSLNGTWQSLGGGWVLQIEDSTRYAWYDVTSISCLPHREAELAELMDALTLQSDTLSLRKGVITYRFVRTDELPARCTVELPAAQRNDPLFNFEVFAATVREHYAFFELNDIDWDARYAAQKARLRPHSTPVELYRIIEETLERLNDNHGYLEATDAVYAALEEEAASAETEPESSAAVLPEYGDFQIAAMVAEHHLEEEMTQDSWLIQWGRLTDRIGYMQVKAMWLYADLEIPPALIDELGFVDAYVTTFQKRYEGDYIEREVAGVSRILDRAVEDLAALDTLVIDVRFNGGGQDAVSFEILSRFITRRRQIATQQLRYGDQFSPTEALYIDSAEPPFTGPVYVLTSPQTGSAAEALAIATLALPRVQRIGSATAGAMSTALEKTLPNGWSFAISNEIYMDNEGNNYENRGVPVDYELDYSRDRQTFFRSVAGDLAGDKRAILSAVRALGGE